MQMTGKKMVKRKVKKKRNFNLWSRDSVLCFDWWILLLNNLNPSAKQNKTFSLLQYRLRDERWITVSFTPFNYHFCNAVLFTKGRKVSDSKGLELSLIWQRELNLTTDPPELIVTSPSLWNNSCEGSYNWTCTLSPRLGESRGCLHFMEPISPSSP